MRQLKSYIALFLLLLFVRAMVPDGLLLNLHSHEHTDHELPSDQHKAQLDKKHIHCDIEDLFGAPYQPGVAAVDFSPIVHATVYAGLLASCWLGAPVSHAYLRGPPVA